MAKESFRAVFLSALMAIAPLSFSEAQQMEGTCPFTWQRNLKTGATGEDVIRLQKMLNSDPATLVAAVGAGSPGFENERFGPRTASAVSKFQEKYASEILAPIGLSKGTGAVGTKTREKLNALCASQAAAPEAQEAVPASSAAPALAVSAGAQPAPTILPQGALRIPFTVAQLSARGQNVEISSVTVERIGAGQDGAFESVVLLDGEGEHIVEEKRLNAQHIAVLKFEEPLIIKSGEQFTIVVAGNMEGELADHAGEMPSFRISAIEANAPVEGILPIVGTAHTVNATLAIGSAQGTLSSYDPNGATIKYIDDKGVRFAGIRISAGSAENIRLSGIEWYQGGSAGSEDIENVMVFVNGISHVAEASEREYSVHFPGGILIKKGETIDVYLAGDLRPTAANRTVEFHINASDDVELTGETYGLGIELGAGGNTASSGNSVFRTTDGTTSGELLKPFFVGSTFSIRGGTVGSVSRATN